MFQGNEDVQIVSRFFTLKDRLTEGNTIYTAMLTRFLIANRNRNTSRFFFSAFAKVEFGFAIGISNELESTEV